MCVSLRPELCGHGCRSDQGALGAEGVRENTEEIGRKGEGQEIRESSEREPTQREAAVGHLGRALYTHSPSLNTPWTEKQSIFS